MAVATGGLISESFFFHISSHLQNHDYPPKEKESDLAPGFGDLRHSEKHSKIKPPLFDREGLTKRS